MMDVAPDDRIWAFTRIENARYALAGMLVAIGSSESAQHAAGKHCVYLNTRKSRFYNVEGAPDFSPIVRSLGILAKASALGRSFQGPAGVRNLSSEADKTIEQFANGLQELTKSDVGQGEPMRRVRSAIPRQPDLKKRLDAEYAAIRAAWNHFAEQGYSMKDRQRENVGWDLEAARGPDCLLLEVKGLSGIDLCVELTPNEYRHMRKYKRTYRVCVLVDALGTSPRLSVFRCGPTDGSLIDDTGKVLHVEPRTGARLQLIS
jgi:hypothetical protein